MTIAILMPHFNEKALVQTLSDLAIVAPRVGGITVFVVDDGSANPPNESTFAAIATSDEFRVVLARHAVNLGQGAAIETARRLALREGAFEGYITMDADGQHGPDDIPRLVDAIRNGADVVLGNRFAGDSNVPWLRKLILAVACRFEAVLTGIVVHDAHNGLRAFSPAVCAAISIRQNRMAHATEIKQELARLRRKNALVVKEVPVSIRYSADTLGKGQSSLGAFTIVSDLFHRAFFGEAE